MATKQIWFRTSSFQNVRLINGNDKFPDKVVRDCVAVDAQAIINKERGEVVVDAGSICQALTRIGASESAEWIRRNCSNKMIFGICDVSVLWTEPGVYMGSI